MRKYVRKARKVGRKLSRAGKRDKLKGVTK